MQRTSPRFVFRTSPDLFVRIGPVHVATAVSSQRWNRRIQRAGSGKPLSYLRTGIAFRIRPTLLLLITWG